MLLLDRPTILYSIFACVNQTSIHLHVGSDEPGPMALLAANEFEGIKTYDHFRRYKLGTFVMRAAA